MRISELLHREPFPIILQNTLSLYWSLLTGKSIHVVWGHHPHYKYIWRGNKYLNFFCRPDVQPHCFYNIIREYSYTRKWWLFIFQYLYVQLATSPYSRHLFSQICFSVSDTIPDAHNQLVIGGRSRIRIINTDTKESIVIAKVGHPRLGFNREVSVRSTLPNTIAPEFYGLRCNGMAFAEEYFVGTPANRLPKRHGDYARQQAIQILIQEVHMPSLQHVTFRQHFQFLVSSITHLSYDCGKISLLLADFVTSSFGNQTVGVTMTHGDFQNANILVNSSLLKIIDWETATRRSQLYDLATLLSGIRLSPNHFDTWRSTVDGWLLSPQDIPRLLVPICGRTSLLSHAVAWWLEETLFQLEESYLLTQRDSQLISGKLLSSLSLALEYVEGIRVC